MNSGMNRSNLCSSIPWEIARDLEKASKTATKTCPLTWIERRESQDAGGEAPKAL